MKLLLFVVFVLPVGLLATLNPGSWEKSFSGWLEKYERLHHLLTWMVEGWIMLLILFVFSQAALVLYTGILALVEMLGGPFVIAQIVVGLVFYWKYQTVWRLRQRGHPGAAPVDS